MFAVQSVSFSGITVKAYKYVCSNFRIFKSNLSGIHISFLNKVTLGFRGIIFIFHIAALKH